MTSEPAPVPKPRTRYSLKGSEIPALLDQSAANGEQEDTMLQRALSNQTTDTDALPEGGDRPDRGVDYLCLASITDMISSTIPSLSGVASSISAPAPIGPDSMKSTVASPIPSLPGAANALANPASSAGPATSSAPNLESIASSLATDIPALTGLVGSYTKPRYRLDIRSTTSSTSSDDKHLPSTDTTGDTATDVGALSQLVMAVALGPAPQLHSSPNLAGSSEVPPLEEPRDEEVSPPPCEAVLAEGRSQAEPETESSNEDEGPVTPPAFPSADEPMEEASSHQTDGNIKSVGLAPCRPPPPPPIKKQKTPRAATIRVSRKKKKGQSEKPNSATVVRMATWLDIWKGFRHSVVWASLDGPLMSLWKKRTDKSSEMVFHVSSITRVKRQDKGGFSVYFGKKRHYDFMAHNDAVQQGWISALLSSRGQEPPAPPQHHGPLTFKDPRNRVYASVVGQELWVYHNKEDYQVGVAWFSIPLNVASVKPAGKRGFSLVTPYRTFSVTVDSTADLSVWQNCLSASIRSALSSNQVALRLWENPSNKVCGDCGAASPEWASVNLLLLLCEPCAGQHRALGTSLSKVRSLTYDSKVWAEPLIQLFVCYGNRVANQIWSPAVPLAEQLLPAASDEERSEFIRNKYTRACYRRPHPLASSPALLYQRLCKVVCGEDIEETMALLCSGAKLSCQSEPQSQSPLSLAEKAGQTLQLELLRLNEYIEVPPFLPLSANRSTDSSNPGEEEEELHGKLEEDRFLFSLENDSAACDVLDLREVRTILLQSSLEFEIVTLTDRLMCASDNQLELHTHLLHILQVILPAGLAELATGGVLAVSRVCLLDGFGCPEGWAVLNAAGVSIYPSLVQKDQLDPIHMPLDSQTHYEIDPNENSFNFLTGKRNVHLRFEDKYSCEAWLVQLKDVLANHGKAPQPPVANQNVPLYPVKRQGTVPAAVERCISHITQHGLQVDGIYRRCGLVPKVCRLMEALRSRPDSALMEENEQGVLDVGSALKQYVREQPPLFPPKHQELWVRAAAQPDEPARLASYGRLLRQLPDNNRATLNALIGHFYMIQMFSSQNQMTALNLALVLVPTLFQHHHADLVRLIREMIIHHYLLFLAPEEEEQEEQITVF